MTADIVIPNCGDGVVSSGEACDDGDTEPGDGCDAACTVEQCWVCILEPSVCFALPGSCNDGNACTVGDMRKLRAFFVAVTDALVRHKLLAAAVLLLAVLFYFQPNLVTCETYTKKGGFTGMFEFVETTCHLGGPLPPVPPLL